MKIPKIIHQTWRTQEIPQVFAHDAQSWKKHNPDWQIMGWDDRSLAAFVRQEYPHLGPLYDGYSRQIDRVMMARYLILHKFGGVFVDMDLECIRPIEPLLADHELLCGLEPETHLENAAPKQRGMRALVGTAFLASVAGHPFWNHTVQELWRSMDQRDPLEATGAVFLTSAIASYPGRDQLVLASSAQIYPFDREQMLTGEAFDIEFWEATTREAYTVHRWEGSWIPAATKRFGVVAQMKGRLLTENSKIGPANPRPLGQDGVPQEQPLISCLMVTRDRVALAMNAIACYQKQTYPNKELVIVEHAPNDSKLSKYVAALGDPTIKLSSVPSPEMSLGEVRNVSIERASGHYVATWDDDDFSDPFRLEAQFSAIQQTQAHACMLSRLIEWWPGDERPGSGRLSISQERPWENTLLCERAAMPRYANLPRAEDVPLKDEIILGRRVAYLQMPRLYVYHLHGVNTWPPEFAEEAHWKVASLRYTGEAYERVLGELTRRLPMIARVAAGAAAPKS